MNNLAKILEKSHYQTFELIKGDKRDSDSKGRFELSRLSSYDLKDKNVLDVGCNAGYFLFKLIDHAPNLLVGIELGKKFVYVANALNDYYFKSPIVKFIQGDFFNYTFGLRFDLIICFSTLHYFEDVQDFFNKCYDLLNKDGILLIEVEEFPIGSLNFQNYTKEKFNLTNNYRSIRQKIHDRQFYEYKKV